jgi:hypothetical protein
MTTDGQRASASGAAPVRSRKRIGAVMATPENT